MPIEDGGFSVMLCEFTREYQPKGPFEIREDSCRWADVQILGVHCVHLKMGVSTPPSSETQQDTLPSFVLLFHYECLLI